MSNPELDNIIEEFNNLTMAKPTFTKVHSETIPEFDGQIDELKLFIYSIDNIYW